MESEKLNQFVEFCSRFYTPVMQNAVSLETLEKMSFSEEEKQVYEYVQEAFVRGLSG